MNTLPPADICNGYAHGICSCARKRSNIGINSAKCSSALRLKIDLKLTKRNKIYLRVLVREKEKKRDK